MAGRPHQIEGWIESGAPVATFSARCQNRNPLWDHFHPLELDMTIAEAGARGRPAGPRRAFAARSLRGERRAAPDKSISHRAVIFSALAEGESRVEGLLESDDVLATARAVAALGAQVSRGGDGVWSITGAPWRSPAGPLDLGNSGTGVRLLMGAAARFDLEAVFTGDASLSSRPMARVLDPLSLMGVESAAAEGGRLPVTLSGRSDLTAIDYTPPVASAQVKSAILLAGLGAEGDTIVREPRLTRAHTETMGPLYGAKFDVTPGGAGAVVRVTGGVRLHAHDLSVPGDPSSAAFLVAAALITPDSDITIKGVMTNPARFGLYETLQEMGADLTLTPAGSRAGEALVDIRAKSSALKGVVVPPERAPSMIDEYPILSVVAANADGRTEMRGLAELRAKESDRLAASAALLQANGVNFQLGDDDLRVEGRGPGGVPGGGLVATHHDHRLAMSGLVMGLAAREPVRVDDVAMIATSYPGFFSDMAGLGARIE
jgi:3-phosphoshikimate 1-carboxyvinyltransferase